MPAPIRLLLADVDGTLVTQNKQLTNRAIEAVHQLHAADVHFAITSGRPPKGMSMLIEPLDLSTPIAAFNGGLVVQRDFSVIEQRTVPEELVGEIVDMMRSSGLDSWIYRGADWYVIDPEGAHVDRESATVEFAPTVVLSYDNYHGDVAKIVGISDDHDAMATATTTVAEKLGTHVSAAQSQPYYLDVTHPDANKGTVATFLSERYGIPTDQIATIGDQPNDVLMFAQSGLSIAMGNSSLDVQHSADEVTASNEEEGFAIAVERLVLPRA